MPPSSVAVALLALVVLVESSARVRLPVGLLLAIAVLGAGTDPLAAILIGAGGATAARGWLALRGRRGRSTAGGQSQLARRAMLERLGSSRAYARTTFLLGAMPAVPPTFSFPLLGSMRGSLWPALAGAFVGRVPVLAVTMFAFASIARFLAPDDATAARALALFAAALLLVRLLALLDRDHHARTGSWRLRDPSAPPDQVTSLLGGGARGRSQDGAPWSADELVVEGELLGEDVDPPDQAGGGEEDEGPPTLPPTGLAPS